MWFRYDIIYKLNISFKLRCRDTLAKVLTNSSGHIHVINGLLIVVLGCREQVVKLSNATSMSVLCGAIDVVTTSCRLKFP